MTSSGSQASSGHTAAGLPVNGPSAKASIWYSGMRMRLRLCPEWMGMVERPLAMAEAGSADNCATDVFARLLDRGLDLEALRHAGGDRRGQCAAGAVGMAAVDPRALPDAQAGSGRENVVNRAAGEVATLQQGRGATEVAHLLCRLPHRREAVDRAPQQDLGFRKVRGQYRGARHEPMLQRLDRAGLDQRRTALRYHDRVDNQRNV